METEGCFHRKPPRNEHLTTGVLVVLESTELVGPIGMDQEEN
jgi:hypothetical protein